LISAHVVSTHLEYSVLQHNSRTATVATRCRSSRRQGTTPNLRRRQVVHQTHGGQRAGSQHVSRLGSAPQRATLPLKNCSHGTLVTGKILNRCSSPIIQADMGQPLFKPAWGQMAEAQ
jgi:hypothetical protein